MKIVGDVPQKHDTPSTREPETVKPPVVKDKSRKHVRTVAAITVSFIYYFSFSSPINTERSRMKVGYKSHILYFQERPR